MPSLAKHQSNSFTKLLLLGDAKSGKTTSLVSLVAADYELFIIDMDNLLDPLKEAILSRCPDKIGNVHFITLRDKYKAGAEGMAIEGVAKAFVAAVKLIDHWKDSEEDFGKPAEWGSKRILVLDSLSRFCDAAYDFRESMTKNNDGRAIYKDSQDAVESALAHLTSENFRTNVIVICHGQYIELPDKSTRLFPQGVGKALSPKIPSYFPVYVRFVNKAGKRSIQVESSNIIDLAIPGLEAHPELKALSTDDGLAKIFATLRETTAPVAKPQAVTLRRVGK